MPSPLHPSVSLEAVKSFGPDRAEPLLKQLQEIQFPLSQHDCPRIQLAILWMAKGDSDRFRVCLEEARQDWRDVLVGSGLGNADWTDVLRKRGIDYP